MPMRRGESMTRGANRCLATRNIGLVPCLCSSGWEFSDTANSKAQQLAPCQPARRGGISASALPSTSTRPPAAAATAVSNTTRRPEARETVMVATTRSPTAHCDLKARDCVA